MNIRRLSLWALIGLGLLSACAFSEGDEMVPVVETEPNHSPTKEMIPSDTPVPAHGDLEWPAQRDKRAPLVQTHLHTVCCRCSG